MKAKKVKIKTFCKDCHNELGAEGREIKHKSGTVSFLLYNVVKVCPFCRMKGDMKNEKTNE